MILADKIINLRKKNGWSQEELAEQMQVSRQAVSKWEGAQTVPDLEKILKLSELFGVTTDYLLKDEIESEEFTDDDDHTPVKRISLAQANEFLDLKKWTAKRTAAAKFLCVIAAIPLLLLAAASEVPGFGLSENAAASVGVVILLLMITPAVALLLFCHFKNAPFEFLEKKPFETQYEPFETEYGVDGMVREKQKAYRPTYVTSKITATCLCVLSPIPLMIGSFTNNDLFTTVMLCVTLFLIGIGVMLFSAADTRWESMQELLKEGDYAPCSDGRERQRKRIKRNIVVIYWMAATAIYLGWSFLSNSWEITWAVWPVAGVSFVAVACLCNLFIDKEK